MEFAFFNAFGHSFDGLELEKSITFYMHKFLAVEHLLLFSQKLLWASNSFIAFRTYTEDKVEPRQNHTVSGIKASFALKIWQIIKEREHSGMEKLVNERIEMTKKAKIANLERSVVNSLIILIWTYLHEGSRKFHWKPSIEDSSKLSIFSKLVFERLRNERNLFITSFLYVIEVTRYSHLLRC